MESEIIDGQLNNSDATLTVDTICNLTGLTKLSQEYIDLQITLAKAFGVIAMSNNNNYLNDFTHADVGDITTFCNVFERKIPKKDVYTGFGVNQIRSALNKFVPKKKLPEILW